jgi:predicted transcriptional regulator
MKDGKAHGEKLRALRVVTGVGMRDVATAVGCSWRHLQMIETYGRQPSDELLHRLRRELSRLHGRQIDISEICTYADNEAAA